VSEIAATPIVVLFEDRPKQSMVFLLNLSIYLDARVIVATSDKDLKRALAAPDGVHLVVARATFKGSGIGQTVLATLGTSKVPVICLGDDKEMPGLVMIPTDTEVRPLLQAAAKILGITAQSMVSKQRAETYDIQPEFLNMLFNMPCDVFRAGAAGLEKVFTAGEAVPRNKISQLIKQKKPLTIQSLQRLKLVNAVTEQSQKASEELATEGLSDTKKMSILSASVDMVAAQFQSAGMDEETVKLANASIKAVEKIAESATSVGKLVRQLMDAEGGYRYAHSQLITFLGFHVIKMMGWWGDDQRSILSQAAFYHDISLSDDDQARIRSAKSLAACANKDPKFQELVLTHPQLAARELQSAPEISPEVVRVVIQHHGSPVGRGFSTDIAKLDNLAKTFILSEEWCDYLMDIELSGLKADNSARLEQLKGIYKDEQSVQILETFRYLDPKEFSQDFLSDKEVDFAQSLISGGTETTSVLISPDALPDTSIAGAMNEPEKVIKAGKPDAETLTTAKGATNVREDEEILIKGGVAPETDPEKVIKADEPTAGKKPVVKAARAPKPERPKLEPRKPREARLLDVANTTGVAGDKARKLMKTIQERKPNATPEQVETLLKAGGVVVDEATESFVASEEKAAIAVENAKLIEGEKQLSKEERVIEAGEPADEEENIVFKGQAAEAEARQTINGVTDVRKDEEILIKGTAAEKESTKKIGGVTDVRFDEKIVVKGDKPQDLVDRSLTRIMGDDKEKEKELKLKALAGCSDLMKAALGGALDSVAAILTAAPNAGVEMRKTDAEGRTVMHYAAMGGFTAVMKLLGEKGGQVNTADSKRRTPLFFAALYKQNEAFDLLLVQGAKINQQAMGGMTIAMVGAFSGNMHILKVAVEKGVRLDSKDHSGKTAFDLAKQAKHAEAVTYLEAAAKTAQAALDASRPGAKKPATAGPAAA
jgi:hypothetical protein